MDLIMLIVGFLIVLGPMVLIHELGHFIMAKRAGIRVLEFGFGFPPRLLKFWQGKGHLALGSTRVVIPANFKGLPPSAAEYWLEKETQDSEGKKPNKQKLVLDAGDYVDIIADKPAQGVYILRKLAVLDPEKDDVSPLRRETETGVQMRGELAQYVPGTIYSINWLLPLGGFVRMLGEEDPTAPDSFAAAPKRWRAAVLLAGPLMNLVMAFVVLTGAWMIGIQEPVTCRVSIAQVNPNAPAATAGLQAQDFVLKIDDEPMDLCNELSAYVRQHAGEVVELEIERDQEVLTIPVKLRANGEFNPDTEGPLGIMLSLEPLTWQTSYRANLLEALYKSGAIVLATIVGILSLPVLILQGLDLSGILGPIGISQAGSEAIQISRQVGTLSPILMLIGQVSVAVGVTNLLPLPALDGGRLLFIFFEWIRGRRIDPRKEMIIHLIGLALLLILVAIVSYGDVVRFISGQKLF